MTKKHQRPDLMARANRTIADIESAVYELASVIGKMNDAIDTRDQQIANFKARGSAHQIMARFDGIMKESKQ